MLFNSLHFLVFFPVVYCLYWFVVNRNLKLQNALLLLASYYYYACWDWRFLFLLAFSTALDYFTGIRIHEASTPQRRKAWLITSVVINLGILMVFKYYDFFATSFADMMSVFGMRTDPILLDVVIPIGISFYTFHGLSYVFDIYNRKIEPNRSPLEYAVFVSFFPLLVAGPIERATHLLPQIERPRTFNMAQARDGLRQILWGLFKKVVIADSCAPHVDHLLNSGEDLSGPMRILGVILFSFQVYGDFSGYSDIALGSARLMGIELLKNFAYPFFSRNIAELWQRWHISLNQWFMTYLYIPLGGSKRGRLVQMRNILLVFTISGFWHGASWTFVVWGALHALFFIPLIFARKAGKAMSSVIAEGRNLPTLAELGGMLLTFAVFSGSFLFFRADSLSTAFSWIGRVGRDALSRPAYGAAWKYGAQQVGLVLVLLIGVMLLTEWMARTRDHAFAGWPGRWPIWARWSIYYLLIVVVLYHAGTAENFIYFQF